MPSNLIIGSGLAFTAAVVYAVVGHIVRRRPVSEPNRLANQLFSVWWSALAASTFASGLLSVVAYLGRLELALLVAITYVNVVLVVIGLWGLLYYLIFLFTGRRWILTPLSLFYTAYLILLFYFVQAGHPDGVATTGWNATLHYATPQGGLLLGVVIALLILPQLLSAISLFTLVFVVQEREQKYRLSIVSLSIIVWFGTSYLGALTGLTRGLPWQLLTRLLGVAAALAILVAYRPPPAIRPWLNSAKRKPRPSPPAEREPDRAASAYNSVIWPSVPPATAVR